MNNSEMIEEYRANAEAAFSSKQYEQSLDWYKKILAESPDDMFALSRAGAVSVALRKFDEAEGYFEKALMLDPQNGDNYFNMANAYFFHENYIKALELYAQAEQIGCSSEVKPKLYYQMAALCSVKNDAKSALINYKKYEECVAGTNKANDTEIIVEKIKLYLMLENLEQAENCAVQLKAISPTEYKSYVIYFQILLMKGEFEKAEALLDEAKKYASLSQNEQVSLELSRVAIYTGKAEKYGTNEEYHKALELLETMMKQENLNDTQKGQVLLSASEIALKLENFDKSIMYANEVFGIVPTKEVDYGDVDYELMAEEEAEKIDAMIDDGILSDDLGDQVDYYTDDSGVNVGIYGESFDDLIENKPKLKGNALDVSDTVREKLNFVLLSAYLAKEDYASAMKYISAVKSSDNSYYAYFGIYSEAYAYKHLAQEAEKHEAEEKYTEAIAYFRAKMLKQPGDHFAIVFRARLYAESGKFAKAEEMANLLTPEEKSAVMKYIELCRNEVSDK